MKNYPFVLFVAVGLLGAVGGYLVGRHAAGTARAPSPAIAAAEPTSLPTQSVAPVESASRPDPAAIDPEALWRRLSARHEPTPADEKAMAVALGALARRDPQRALSLALAEANLVRRALWRDTVLRAWAANDPESATQWALARREVDRVAAVTAVLHGAVARSPDEAAALGARLCTQDPAHAADYGGALIGALAEAGNFPVAVGFVAASTDTPLRIEQMNTAFQLWAQHQPGAAAAAVDAVADPRLRLEAFRGMAVGWATADPVSLANYAVNLPTGELRAQALSNALPRWVDQNPTAAAEWIGQHDGNADFDMGVVAVAQQPGLIADRPETAMGLAESITDPALRTNTLHNLALTWAQHDVAAARRFIESSTDFSDMERKVLLAEAVPSP